MCLVLAVTQVHNTVVRGCIIECQVSQYAPSSLAALPLFSPAVSVGLDLPPSDGVYRPPKLNPVAMPEDRAVSNKEMRRIREAQRRAQRRLVGRSGWVKGLYVAEQPGEGGGEGRQCSVGGCVGAV